MNNRPRPLVRNTDRNDENIDQLKAPHQTHVKLQDFNRKESTSSFNKQTRTGWGLVPECGQVRAEGRRTEGGRGGRRGHFKWLWVERLAPFH